jgi:MoaA/NifB/PqqE/SkfB family radical SAM enzyme
VATAIRPIAEGWLGPRRIREVILEATSRCNLRCLYCAVSQPGYVGRDLEGDADSIFRDIIALNPGEVQINGHGETTMLPGWVRLADLLTQSRVAVTLTSNLARAFEPHEIETLARLSRLTVSCDTADPRLYALLRRGGRLDRIEANLRAIRTVARSQGTRGPFIAINCTFSHRVVAGLSELVRWGARLDLDAVALTNLVVYPGLPGKLVLRHPAQVDPVGAQRSIEDATRVASELGLKFFTMGGLDEDLDRAVRSMNDGQLQLASFDENERAPLVPAAGAVMDRPVAATPTHTVPPGLTRDCVDPWEQVFVHADGGVSLCCWAGTVGNLQDASLADIVTSAGARALRRELLTGELSHSCQVCPARGLTTIPALQSRLDRLELPPGVFARAMRELSRRLVEIRKTLMRS